MPLVSMRREGAKVSWIDAWRELLYNQHGFLRREHPRMLDVARIFIVQSGRGLGAIKNRARQEE